MRSIAALCAGLGFSGLCLSGLGLSGSAFAAPAPSGVIHQFDDLALAPAGDKTATVESDDPGDLTDEPHGAVIVRDEGGKIVAHYDPCAACRYSGTAWSPKGDALVFLAADEKAGKTTLYRAANGKRAVPDRRFPVSPTRRAFLGRWRPHRASGDAWARTRKQARPRPRRRRWARSARMNDEQRIAVLPASGGALKPRLAGRHLCL